MLFHETTSFAEIGFGIFAGGRYAPGRKDVFLALCVTLEQRMCHAAIKVRININYYNL
jgi:hypothetical protein